MSSGIFPQGVLSAPRDVEQEYEDIDQPSGKELQLDAAVDRGGMLARETFSKWQWDREGQQEQGSGREGLLKHGYAAGGNVNESEMATNRHQDSAFLLAKQKGPFEVPKCNERVLRPVKNGTFYS